MLHVRRRMANPNTEFASLASSRHHQLPHRCAPGGLSERQARQQARQHQDLFHQVGVAATGTDADGVGAAVTAVNATPSCNTSIKPITGHTTGIRRRVTCNASTQSGLHPTHQQQQQQQQQQQHPEVLHTDALIVGGGPAGLATARMLASKGLKVVVAERHGSFSYSDPDRSYVHGLDARGRQFTDKAGMTPKLADIGVDTRVMSITRVFDSGKVTMNDQVTTDALRVMYWLPRDRLMKLFESEVAAPSPLSDSITLLTDTAAVAIQRAGRAGAVTESGSTATPAVTAAANAGANGNGSRSGQAAPLLQVELRSTPAGRESRTVVVVPQLLVGCDGMNSSVRNSLQAWAAQDGSSHHGNGSGGGDNGSSIGGGGFHAVTLPSLSTGLRFKVLAMPPNPTMRDGTAIANSRVCLLVGRTAPTIGGQPMRLGMLPVKDSTAGRTANLITLPGHPVWDVMDAETMYKVLDEAFPQADWRALVPPPIMAKFAASRGGTFPAPQYSDGLAMVLSQYPAVSPAAPPAVPPTAKHIDALNDPLPMSSDTVSGNAMTDSTAGGTATAGGALRLRGTGVVLLGDSAHCFPPDLGQGVNSALEDVCVLEKHLEAASGDLTVALPAYERERQPDAAALAKLVQIGFPLQYNQYPLRRWLWGLTFMAQLGAHKVLPFLVSPPLFMRITNPALCYSQILRDTERSWRVMNVLYAGLAAALAWLVVKAVELAARRFAGAV